MELIRNYPTSLSISYFGAQGRFADEIIKIVMQNDTTASRYIDLTAGGMGVPYNLARNWKIPVTVNDLSFYSYICGIAVFEHMARFADYDDRLFRDIYSAVIPKEGFLTSKAGGKSITERYGNWSISVRKFVDALAEEAKSHEILLAALGRTLLNEGTFRGLTWCGTSPDKKKLADITVEEFWNKVMRNTAYFAILSEGIDASVKKNCQAYRSHASEFVKKYNEFEDAIVYMDPAWPWLPEFADASNPYNVVAHDIPEILLQNPMVMEPLWTRENPEEILNNLEFWISQPLLKGARRVIVSSQSTNYPPINEVDFFLKSKFNAQEVVMSTQFSGQAKSKMFTENWWVIKQ